MKEKIVEAIIERAAGVLGVEASSLSEDTLFSDLNIKSTHFTMITTYLEDQFDAEVPYMNFKRCKSLGEAADFVVDLLEE